MNRLLASFILFLIFCTRLYAEDHILVGGKGDHSLSLARNDGQWEPFIKYKAFLPGGAVFLTNEGFTYSFYSREDLNKLHDLRLQEGKDISDAPVRMHAYKMYFEGANQNATIVAEDEKPYYYNYLIGNDRTKWKSKVPVFNRVGYQDIYDGVDLLVYSSQGTSFKYDFIVKPHKKADEIVLFFEGVSPSITKSGSLRITTSIGEINESAPYCYQEIGGVRKEVRSRYRQAGKNRIGFQLDNYDPNYPVVIDPSLVFATYSGSNTATYGFCATYDNQGNLIEAGELFNIGWPVKTGAFQTSFGGRADLGINRFNSTGTALLHSTYLGGVAIEQPVSLICDNNLELYILSVTQSANFPVSNGCYDNSFNGGQLDLAITHLDNSFSNLIGSTFLGGLDRDGSFNGKGEIYLDALNNIIIGSYSASRDYPVSQGAIQMVYGGGTEDGVISIVNNTCSNLIASTFVGGSGEDRITGIRKMPNGNIAAAGSSSSTNYPVTPLAYQTTSGASENGVVSLFSPTLMSLLASTYVHSPSTAPNDRTYMQFVDFDKQNNLYVYGNTDTSFPVTPGKYFNANGQTLVAKFSPTLNAITWSTRIGASNSTTGYAINPTAFLADNCGKIYMAGYGSTMSSYPLTADAISTKPEGFWIGVLDVNATSLVFGTFFGTQGDHLDGGTSRFDKKGVIYHAVCCGNSNFPVTPNAAYPTTAAIGGYDIVGYKLDSETQAVVAMSAASPGLFSCTLPFTVSFNNLSQNGVSYFWDFGDGNTDVATQPTHTYTTSGIFNVMLVASNPNSCNTHDTIYLPVQILNDSFELVNNDTTYCFQNGFIPVTLTAQVEGATSNVNYSWVPNGAILSNTLSQSITIDPSIDSIFIVVAIDSIPGKCRVSDTDTIVVRAIEIGDYYALPDTTIRFCTGQSFQLSTTGQSINYYEWKDLSGTSTIAGPYSPTPIITPTQTTQFVVFIYDGPRKNCFVTDTVNVEERPSFDVVSSPTYACKGDTVLLHVDVSPGNIPFDLYWKNSNGSEPSNFISGQNSLTPTVAAQMDMDYIIRIIARDTAFCESTDTIHFRLFPSVNLEAGPDEIIRYGTFTQLRAKGNGKFTWTPDYQLSSAYISDPIASPLKETLYYVTAVTEEGCKETDSVRILVTNSSLPSGFTPNGDGKNDVLRILKPNDLGKLGSFHIYDRWGNEVFHTQDINEGWDGRYKGEPADMGVYFYSLIYTIGKVTYHDKGDVSLMR